MRERESVKQEARDLEIARLNEQLVDLEAELSTIRKRESERGIGGDRAGASRSDPLSDLKAELDASRAQNWRQRQEHIASLEAKIVILTLITN